MKSTPIDNHLDKISYENSPSSIFFQVLGKHFIIYTYLSHIKASRTVLDDVRIGSHEEYLIPTYKPNSVVLLLYSHFDLA